MHLLHLIGTLDPSSGGPSEAVRVLLAYAPSDCTGEVVTLDDPDAPFLKDLPYRVHALGPQKATFGYNSRLLPWLRENHQRFDGVLVNGLWQYLGYAAWRALRRKTPYAVYSHGMLDPYFKRKFPLKHLKKWAYWVAAEYWVLRDAYRVLFTTEEEARLARQSFWMHRWNAEVISFGARRPEGLPGAQREAFYAECPAVRGRRFILFLGRIHRKKGCDMLVDAFAKLKDRDPELHLVMAGPDQQGWIAELQEKAVQGGVGDRVHWPGILHGDAKWGAFFASEVFALPSHQENFGIAVAEALACARPVLLAHPVNIASEIAGDGAGFAEDDSPAGTEKLLLDWIDLSPGERTAMNERALACFNRRYDMRNNVAIIWRLFETVSQRAPRTATRDRRTPEQPGRRDPDETERRERERAARAGANHR